MKKLSRKSKNLIFIASGAVVAAALVFAATPIYEAMNLHGGQNRDREMAEISDVVIGDTVSIMKGEYTVKGLSGMIDYDKMIDCGKEEVPTPKEDEKKDDEEKKDEEKEDEEVKEEEQQPGKSEESNTPIKKSNSVATTILGIAASVCTLGLAVFIVRAILVKGKKKEN